MPTPDWTREFPGAMTVCDTKGIILEMNEKSIATFGNRGGAELIGSNVLDCHPEPARSTLQSLLETGQTNAYTIEKNGVHKLIYQTPWYEDGVYRGLVELSLELPHPLPHFVREAQEPA